MPITQSRFLCGEIAARTLVEVSRDVVAASVMPPRTPNRRHRMKTFALCLAAFTAFAANSPAQPLIRSITRYRISPAHAGDFQAAMKDYNEVLTKAGWKGNYSLWTSATGPYEYARVTYAQRYAEFDKQIADDPALKDYGRQLGMILARLNACIENSDRVIEEMQPGLSITPSGNQALVRVVRVVVRPERVRDFLALVTSEVFPAAKQAGLPLFQLSRTRYGGLSTEFRFMVGRDSWADLDGTAAIAKAMGEEKFARYQEKLAALIVETQNDVYRYQPDLSYFPRRSAPK